MNNILPVFPNWTIAQILEFIPYISNSAPVDRIVTGLCYDSRKILNGEMFFALSGAKISGKLFIEQALSHGASAIVTDITDPVEYDTQIPIIRVDNARISMANIANFFYSFPSTHLKIAGVTGTNGKTTTSWIIRDLCKKLGYGFGLIGTVAYILPNSYEKSERTTPESVDLQKMLFLMIQGGFQGAAIEISSHSLVQNRVTNIEFDVAIFTNLTHDHLDYHHSITSYFEAKKTLFFMLCDQKKRGKAVINQDDRYGQQLIDEFDQKLSIITYGQYKSATFYFSQIIHKNNGTNFCLEVRGKKYLIRSPLKGLFNVYNLVAAIATIHSFGIDIRRIINLIQDITAIPGRLERVRCSTDFQVFVDYAHTPDGLLSVLKALRDVAHQRIILVFGCGGDRDKEKRSEMGMIAEKYADQIILTSDNPRHENPINILSDIKQGFSSHANYEEYMDRKIAIYRAIELARKGDIVLIAGKGHETYQEENDNRLPFNDILVASDAIAMK